MLRNVVLSILLFCSFIASADELSLLKSFAQCQPDFFDTLYENRALVEKHTNIALLNTHQAYISVANRADSNKNHVYFKTPMIANGLKIIGYYDSAIDLEKMGKYYFWGFIIDNNLEQIRKSFDFLNWKEMESDLLYIANPKIHYINDNINVWNVNDDMAVGVKTIPAPGTTEKLLLLEKGPTMTMLICSIQGVVLPEMLRLQRPDIQ
ncbi:hypothetical protein PT273_00970 [Orbaceae bacterium ESL0727]|nr:hypothetical protein [Orbaceae bacterium ESL0727]